MRFFFSRLREIPLALPFGKSLYVIGEGAIRHLPRYLKRVNFPARILLISERTPATLHAGKILNLLAKQKISVEFLEIPGGETGKNLQTTFLLYEKLLHHQATRTTGILALGGGVITDLVGFAASTFMRGLPLAFIPTTLLAQADAAIGGKTGVNLENGKNLVGSFYHPRVVMIDPNFLETLPERELKNGFPEIIKMAFLEGEKEFRNVEEYSKNRKISTGENLSSLLYSAVSSKIKVVRKDPEESDKKGARMKLNLGHTFAHALEAATEYQKYTHGEAVSIGLLGACFLAEEVTKFPSSVTDRLEKLLLQFGLPIRYSHVSPEKIVACMAADKKKRETLRFVLPLQIGKVAVKEKIREETILKALSKLKE